MIETYGYKQVDIKLDEKAILNRIINELEEVNSVDEILEDFAMNTYYYLEEFIPSDVEVLDELDEIYEAVEDYCLKYVEIQNKRPIIKDCT